VVANARSITPGSPRLCGESLFALWNSRKIAEYVQRNDYRYSRLGAPNRNILCIPIGKGASEVLIKRVPKAIKTFSEAFQSLEPRQQKAQLQTTLKAATVYKDGRIELEFRGQNS
jgi:hypothetical protein